MKIALYVNETFITELSDEKVEEVFVEYIEENHPEYQIIQAEDFIKIIPTDY